MMNDEIYSIILKQIRQPLWESWYIKEEIGKGSASRVYRAVAQREHRTDSSALKIKPILPENKNYPSEKQKKAELDKKRALSVNETTILYKLRRSPNIVLYEEEKIIPVKKDGKLCCYAQLIRMELLTCVKSLMEKGAFDLSEDNVLKLALDIGNGIRSAHAINIIHNDIKPGNFFVSPSGEYMLGDFDISKRAVNPHSFAGTEGFIAPEVYRTKDEENNGYTSQADIYSFGISLYYIMNGYKFPFADKMSEKEAFSERMSGKPLPSPMYASDGFSHVILKACAYSPDERYADMEQMIDDLTRLRQHDDEDIIHETESAGNAPAKVNAFLAAVAFILLLLLIYTNFLR